MPDGDIVHPTLHPRYTNVYKQMCESTSSQESETLEEDLARRALTCLKADIKEFGDEPIQLIEQEAAILGDIVARIQQGESIDWVQARRDMHAIAQQFVGSKKAFQLVEKACAQQLQIIQTEQRYALPATDVFRQIAQGYVLNIYDAHFAKKVEQTRDYWNQASSEAVRDLLSRLRPRVIQGIAAFSDQMLRQGHVHTLRLPRRKGKLRKIDLAYDIDRDLSEIL